MAGIAQAAAFDRVSQQIRAMDSRMGGMTPLDVLVVNAVAPNQGPQPTEPVREIMLRETRSIPQSWIVAARQSDAFKCELRLRVERNLNLYLVFCQLQAQG